ncbi:MAG: arginine--tRNA ligase [Thermomicrobiales bacterium]
MTAGTASGQEEQIRERIAAILAEQGYTPRTIDLRRLPFSGQVGLATSVAMAVAGQAAAEEIAAATAGLDKAAARETAQRIRSGKVQEIASLLADRLQSEELAGRVEVVNGYVNIYFDSGAFARQIVERVLAEDHDYGRAPANGERVMVEFSQPNTHKAFHVGHLRNVALGNALCNILDRAGFAVLRANYIGDIGRHVILCLWCYKAFHYGDEPEKEKGRWLGQLYAESYARLNFRKDVTAFINHLTTEDEVFRLAADRMMKELWRKKRTAGEDIAYLLGQLSNGRGEFDPAKLYDPNCLVDVWPIIGAQLREEVQPTRAQGMPADESIAKKYLAEWEQLDQRIDWWIPSATWGQDFKDTWRLWEEKDPAFIALWERTKAWSMEEFHRIYAELGVTFDVWYFESEVEEEGRDIVEELLANGIAEISEGLPVVKIDEKLGLEKETYRVLPILRSDGTTLYSTKDLALTRRKFTVYHLDRAYWVVAVEQALYFQQILKILELMGFEQAAQSHHLSYELVMLKGSKIGSRSGNTPLYDDLAADIFARAQMIIEEKNPDLPAAQKQTVARQVGVGALLYGMLDRDNNKVIVFDLDEALSLQGQSAPYIQYAHARACRILERAGGAPDFSSGLPAFGDLTEQEINLVEQIALLPAEVQRAARDYKPLVIATYAYELATRTNDFYEHCRVLDAPEPQRTVRLAIVDAARRTLAAALALLGIAAPEAM